MDERLNELDYYRSQCDELGGRVLRLQEDVTQARREAQRHRTLAMIVQELYTFAHDAECLDSPSGTLEDAFLMLMVERLQVDCAALLRWQPDSSGFRVEFGLGVASGLWLPAPPPAEAGGTTELPATTLSAAGLATGLWVVAPPSSLSLLLGHRQLRTPQRKRLEDGNRPIAETALKVYNGLLEQHQAALALRASEANYRTLFEGAQDAILVLDSRDRSLLDANQRALELLACPLDELRRQAPSAWLVPADLARWKSVWEAALAGHPQRVETRIRPASGRLLWTEINVKRIDTDRRLLLAVVRDISARKQSEEALKRVQERLDLALEGAEVGLYDVNLETGELVVDERYLRMVGGDPQLIATTLEDWLKRIHPDDRPTVQRLRDEALTGHRQKIELEYRVRHQSGAWIWILDRGKGFDWDEAGRPRRAAGTCVDITARKTNEASIHRLAFYDSLTDLPNRRLFLDRLSNAHAAARRGGYHGAVLFLDLDHFKQVNDARGHEAGDHLLQEVAARLTPLLRTEDTVARFGGDEFVILLVNLTRSAQEAPAFARSVAEKVRQALASPFQLQEGEFVLGASIGVTLFCGTERSVHDILREADTALYQAKASGRNSVHFFESSMQVAVEARFDLEGELRHAVDREQLRLFLQPQVDAAGHIVGAEALLRWQHPSKGLISPAVFIPLAEETGLIVPVGQWVLNQACQILAGIAGRGQSLRISVNVSPRQFRQADFVASVREVLARTGVAPACLVLEITEGLVIEDLQHTIDKMHELKACGVRLSLDDFGTGYSSLTYLKRMPIDELKIDRSFVRDAPVNDNDAALVEVMLSVSRHFHLEVVAEGVETLDQLNFLKAHGCRCFQGYLLGRPMPAETFLSLMDDGSDQGRLSDLQTSGA
ncbi:EAL domain-containing protein [Thiorhodococcus mannitoliphagus]|uniref:cyclic-guanylate-specific phosphodiesterase n=1 Tax=Thiorhodococcus mannitoliphagus TaxID=329406 RepID=A0A6P1DRE8_9GAMM|nr:GGDEF domain-containing phosphodiesterase [Thiorhodococcus mannitoliphagus]NEX19491.1 EAL domain-containing protein [Thiorhodococcus mannitoliphagus]